MNAIDATFEQFMFDQSWSNSPIPAVFRAMSVGIGKVCPLTSHK